MQNFKDVILKNLCSAVIFFTYLLVMPSVWMAEGADVPPQIFIGNGPSAITIQQGMPVEIPVFFVGGTYCDKTVELYVFRTEDGRNVCFGPEGWESDDAIALEDFKPLCNVPGLPEYLLLQWQAFKDSQSLSDFDLCICVDDQIDGIFTTSSSCCGCQSIIIEEVDDDPVDVGDDGVNGDGDDDDDDTGDVSSPGLVAPPFPDLGGNSDGSCNSLEYIPEGTTFSQSSISKSLELGESEQITLLASACGDSVTVSSVNRTSGGEWLSASLSGGKVILNLTTTGLQTGSSNTGTVKVVAGGITDNMYITLRVLGQCDPTSASVTPTSLTFQAYVGGQSPSAQTIRVKDDCGDAVDATVSSKPAWLTLSNTGTGVFSASCVDSYLEEEDSYSGTITLTDSDSKQHSVSATLKVTDTPPPPPDDSVTTVTSGHMDYYNVGAGETKYFKFVASVFDNQPIIVISTPGSSQPRTVHILVKRGDEPSIAEFKATWDLSYSLAGSGVYEDLYWYYSTGSAGEMVKINEPMEEKTYYVMMYNAGETKVYGQQFTVSYYN